MKAKGIFLVLSLQFIFIVSAVGQITQDKLKGSWMGHLSESGMDIRLVFNFSLSPADTLMATLDSPDQSVEGLHMGRVIINDTVLYIDAPLLRGHYRGKIQNDTIIKGSWSQGGKEYIVNLEKMKEPLKIVRPQEPKPPFPYTVEDVLFRNNKEGFDLAGTLTIPEGTGPFPAVILISGSGYQDRDEKIFNHKPFLVIADYLTRNGIAVLRYDDRGTGSSKGNKTNATSETLAGDAESALTYLMTRPEINAKHIGVAGHSEGGLIAAIVASGNKNVSFVISLAGPGVPGAQIITTQTRDISITSGMDTAKVSKDIKTLDHVFKMIMAEPDQKKLAKDAMQWYASELDSEGVDPEKRKEEMAGFAKSIVTFNNAWFRYFIITDPKTFWKNVTCPVLALNGEKDLQVNYTDNLDGIREALKKSGNRKVIIMSFAGLNHLFQHCTTGLPTEYNSIEETFSPDALKIISEWIKLTVNKKK